MEATEKKQLQRGLFILPVESGQILPGDDIPDTF